MENKYKVGTIFFIVSHASLGKTIGWSFVKEDLPRKIFKIKAVFSGEVASGKDNIYWFSDKKVPTDFRWSEHANLCFSEKELNILIRKKAIQQITNERQLKTMRLLYE